VSVTTIFGSMEKMNRKGVVLNAAFSVSASFVFGSHLAFTMAFDSSYLAPMMVGKLLSGVCAVVVAMLLYKEKTDEV
jgi:ethanolamine transporter